MNRLVNLLNPQQWKLVAAMLFGATGPLAWFLSKKLGLSGDEVKMWLDFAAVLMPAIGGIFVAAAATNAAQVQAVAAMPIADKAKAMEAVSPAGQASIAAALPDQTVVRAAAAVPGVQAHVDERVAPLAVVRVANDPTATDVVTMIGGPRIDPGKLG